MIPSAGLIVTLLIQGSKMSTVETCNQMLTEEKVLGEQVISAI
jgi:hypothetical protein